MDYNSKRLDLYTSTGSKFWSHEAAMRAYREGRPESVVLTHVSPTSACNLSCPYCSVRGREVSTIPLKVIRDYVLKLKTLGLKAVILTGGGEPTLYPDFYLLTHWLRREQGLRLGLITNGTSLGAAFALIEDEKKTTLAKSNFDWIRISVNDDQRLWTSVRDLETFTRVFKDVVFGLSVVLTEQSCSVEYFQKILREFEKVDIKYVRVLADCCSETDGEVIERVDRKIDSCLEQVPSPLWLHQVKRKQAPTSHTCHQSYFRPYLSEVHFEDRGPGTVYPCDSVVLGDQCHKFPKLHQLCYAGDVLEYLNHNVKAKFDPTIDCHGCVFTQNVNMLENYINGWFGAGQFTSERTEHCDFI
jgi:MoaA/NifB/PqqE/SkfB family radical SAM enzyme